MSGSLLDIIRQRITQHGPMDLGEYMSLCLGHPQYGYYMTRDPFGVKGDFITAPEVSQMFGEMIGVWLADTWMKMGAPTRFALVECGPGRGTLMEDALRATRHVPGFHQAMALYLMEISPVLKEVQGQKLNKYDPVWVDDLEGVPTSVPILLIANEFLDALPIRQIRYDEDQWVEAVVSFDNDTLCLSQKPLDQTLMDHVPEVIQAQRSGEVFECSPILNCFMKSLSECLEKQTGSALFIDYGHAATATGNTLQAVRSHRFESIFETPGSCDLTAHVDFENIVRLARGASISASSIITQSAFLKSLGIDARAAALKESATEKQADDIDAALDRLTGENQMGLLFKVIALCHDASLDPAGFNSPP